MNQNLRVVDLAKFVVMDVLVAQLRGQVIERLIGLLADGLVHLHLQDQVRAALQVQAQLDALPEIVAQLRQPRWETWAGRTTHTHTGKPRRRRTQLSI